MGSGLPLDESDKSLAKASLIATRLGDRSAELEFVKIKTPNRIANVG
jgi:hypothetical protein